MHIIVPSFGGMGEALFKVSVTRGIVVLFFVRIGALLVLRNASFRTFMCFRRTLCGFLELLYLLSIVDSLVVLIMWNQICRVERRTCTSVCYRVIRPVVNFIRPVQCNRCVLLAAW